MIDIERVTPEEVMERLGFNEKNKKYDFMEMVNNNKAIKFNAMNLIVIMNEESLLIAIKTLKRSEAFFNQEAKQKVLDKYKKALNILQYNKNKLLS